MIKYPLISVRHGYSNFVVIYNNSLGFSLLLTVDFIDVTKYICVIHFHTTSPKKSKYSTAVSTEIAADSNGISSSKVSSSFVHQQIILNMT